MSKKALSVIMMLIGALGALFISVMAITESKADDVVSAIPLTMVFCTLFICGFFSNNSKS